MPSVVHTDQPGARFRGRDLLRTVAEGTAGAVGDEFLRCLVRHVALAFDAKFAFVAEATRARPASTCGWSAAGTTATGWTSRSSTTRSGKPCALVVEQAVVAFPEELTKRFPEAKPAIDMGLESYLAICLRAADGTHLGHMAVMDARTDARPGTMTSPRCASSRRGRRPSSSAAIRRPRCGARARA